MTTAVQATLAPAAPTHHSGDSNVITTKAGYERRLLSVGPLGYRRARSTAAAVSSLDLMATFTAAAGEVKTTEDSKNLLPYLMGQRDGVPHEYLYWRAGPTIAIRDARWKLIRYNRTSFTTADLRPDGRLQPPDGGWSTDSPHGQLTLLYDLSSDPGETTNRADDHPDVVQRLSSEHARWAEPIKVDPILPPLRSTLAEFDGTVVQLLF